MSKVIDTARIPIIHIGLPKTATKTLQWRLFACHSEIFYLGRYDGHLFKEYQKFENGRNELVQKIMNQIAYEDIFNPDYAECKELLQELLAPAREKNLLPVWSWESYSTDSLAKRRIRARNLKQLFGEATIIMTLRNPISLLESAYFQYLIRENTGMNYKIGRPPFYCSIDAWLETEYTEIQPHLEYAVTLQAYIEQFGLENIKVFLFEDLVEDKIQFYQSICDTMSINADEGIKLMDEKVDNSRWTEAQINALKNIQTSNIKSLKYRFANKRNRKKMLSMKGNNASMIDSPKAKAPMSDEWKNKIFTATEKGNHWIEEVFNLQLKKHGYFREIQ
ncbi:MAG: sulfotransferase [Lentisphaeria bacterium]|nr:sulfotransferase [Lentisphaeria bacterium]NQZ66452.1 sulfotransferase [Lentisphaeria bacterium]